MTVALQPGATAPSNLVTHLRTLAHERPDDTALIVVSAQTETALSYADLDFRVRAVAAQLQARFNRGDRALLMLDNDEHYVVAFLGCLYAGLIAVPAFPPQSMRDRHMHRLTAIADDAQARCVLTTTDILAGIADGRAPFNGLETVTVDSASQAAAGRWQALVYDDRDVVFLQYTSGSTARPKGVIIDQGNLMANERAIQQAMRIGASDVFVSWLPLFHDMGLVGGLLQPLHAGIPLILMSPATFLARPVRWLESIAKHGGTISGGPDFAYRLCSERVTDAQLKQLDLSSWRVAFSGAEPVRHDTLHAFARRFAAAGFDADAIYPCYGLAEATLLVTGVERGKGMSAGTYRTDRLATGRAVASEHGTRLVACGKVPDQHCIRIAEPRTGEELPNEHVGEIWVTGPSVSRGYWHGERATAETFVEHGAKRWLRTGDLGFVQNQQLYITGRQKDLIILRGQNIYPQDIERAVEEELEAVRTGRVAAFAVEVDGQEGIGIAAEISRGLQKLVAPEALVNALNVAVTERCGEAPSVVVLLNAGALPKTSSGKLQRSACRTGWSERSLDAYAMYERGRFVLGGTGPVPGEPLDEVEQCLATLWRTALKHGEERRYAADAHFFGVGGNSLAVVELAARISDAWNIPFAPRAVFEQPSLRDLASEIRRTLALGASDISHSIPPLPAESRTGSLVLSHSQRRQWFLWQLDPASTAYHIQAALRLQGRLDVESLSAALAALAARHESLRTLFRMEPSGDVVQLIQPKASWSLQSMNLQSIAPAEREARAIEEMRLLNAQPFDLTRGPPVRALLLCLADDVHILALVMHHIIGDGASMQILLDELAACYGARQAGVEPTLPKLSVQYADYAFWQQTQADEELQKRQLEWWRAELATTSGEHPVLRLQTDRPRQTSVRYRAAQFRFQLTAALVAGLRRRAETSKATLFTVMLAAFYALLYRYTGQRDLRVGVPVANRSRLQTQRVVGEFVNTLVMRNVIDGRLTLAQLLEGTRARSLGAQANQDLPFDRLVQALQPERSLSHSPLFQVMFNLLQEDTRAFAGVPGLSVAIQPTEPNAAQFELSLEIREGSQGSVAASLIYAADLFDRRTMERMANHYGSMLRALAERPELTVGQVEMLSHVEQSELREWSENGQAHADAVPVHRLIERQVQSQPCATALLFGEQRLSYAELNDRANRLAHRLIAAGVAPDTLIGVAMERSMELVVALLAILKAGAAYVPIDPTYPSERIGFMLDDSRTRWLLTQRHLRKLWPMRSELSVIEVDGLDLSGEPHHDPAVPLHGESLVYLIYTSGSTGVPKGAANRHRSLYNRLQWMQDAYRLGAADTVLQKTPYSFDVSVWEFFWPLMAGARLAIAAPEHHRDPARLLELIRRHRVTTLHFVPSMLQAFLAHPGISQCESLTRIICSGEALSAQAQSELMRCLPGAALYNLYGPTEAAIDVTHWTCRDEGRSHVPIGQPISAIQTYVLDEELNLVPPGVAGELYLGGEGLARGYWRRAGLTAQRFIADPVKSDGARLYRTGDVVRWNGQGQLEYLGRIDHQVKIRGFRIELGEIEAQLLAQPQVREAVVVAKAGAVVGYVVGPDSLQVSTLRERLTQVLPEFMVPSAWVILERLPLNANGKVDRAALPDPEPASARTYEPPRGEVEQALAMIWKEVLDLDRVGRHDNFFELGGHSLQLIRVHRLLEERFHADLTIVDLFKHATIAALNTRIERGPDEVQPADDSDEDARRAVRGRATLAQRRRSLERVV